MDFIDFWQYTDMITKALFFAIFALSIAFWITGILRLYYGRQLAKNVTADLTQQLQRMWLTGF